MDGVNERRFYRVSVPSCSMKNISDFSKGTRVCGVSSRWCVVALFLSWWYTIAILAYFSALRLATCEFFFMDLGLAFLLFKEASYRDTRDTLRYPDARFTLFSLFYFLTGPNPLWIRSYGAFVKPISTELGSADKSFDGYAANARQ
jgi:hypothetical protein